MEFTLRMMTRMKVVFGGQIFARSTKLTITIAPDNVFKTLCLCFPVFCGMPYASLLGRYRVVVHPEPPHANMPGRRSAAGGSGTGECRRCIKEVPGIRPRVRCCLRTAGG